MMRMAMIHMEDRAAARRTLAADPAAEAAAACRAGASLESSLLLWLLEEQVLLDSQQTLPLFLVLLFRCPKSWSVQAYK